MLWKPDSYKAFYVCDPKLRRIHKATVRDRVFNQALFRVLYQIFDKGFVEDSYSCRKNKGTHCGVLKLKQYILKVAHNYTCSAYALKCDVRKFFDNIDHKIIYEMIKKKVSDTETLRLINLILKSFETNTDVGLPLGNVTSQLFANIYLNELDQYIKHTLKVKYYVRYCDDFIILDNDRSLLDEYVKTIGTFLLEKLHLNLHPNKIVIRKCTQGIDFLGYVVLPHRNILRTKTKRRIIKKIKCLKVLKDNGFIPAQKFDQTMQSYLGILKHCAGYKIKQQIFNVRP